MKYFSRNQNSLKPSLNVPCDSMRRLYSINAALFSASHGWSVYEEMFGAVADFASLQGRD
ncbi:MAG: hypothetical protein Q8L69_06605 [Gallionellaceae bacterium]|nr:hypothetical protein [Gallionellaceae bacterium]